MSPLIGVNYSEKMSPSMVLKSIVMSLGMLRVNKRASSPLIYLGSITKIVNKPCKVKHIS